MVISFDEYQKMSLGAYQGIITQPDEPHSNEEIARAYLTGDRNISTNGVDPKPFDYLNATINGQSVNSDLPFYTESNGFAAMTLTRPNADGTIDVVISFRGTTLPDDITADALLATGSLSTQFASARNYYQAVVNQLVNVDGDDPAKLNISFTGHSLGGSLAQYMGVLTGDKTVTFNAFGTENILASNPDIPNVQTRGLDNITNYVLSGDAISNITPQVGRTYFADSTGQAWATDPSTNAIHTAILSPDYSFSDQTFNLTQPPLATEDFYDLQTKLSPVVQQVGLSGLASLVNVDEDRFAKLNIIFIRHSVIGEAA